MAINIVFTPIRELGKLIRTEQISPVELTNIFLDRLENLGHKYNAVVTITRKRALKQAERAEQEISSGIYRGPLHGIPYGAKDLLATSGGIPTTWGAEPFRKQTFEYDATIIKKLEAAGAILAAKLAMIELAGGMGYRQPNASFTGPCYNPWDITTWTGGSSSGSGAAVSAGLIPFAIGSETWGSILMPANNCGLAGLRPTYGLVSRYGAMTLCWTLDKLGPICLTADDCGLVLEVIAGADPKDPTTTNRPYQYDANKYERPFRLATLKDVAQDTEDAVRTNFERATKVLEQIANIEEIELTYYPYDAIAQIILNAESASAFEEFIDTGQASKLTAPRDHFGPYARMTVLARDYIKALRLRGVMAKDIDEAMSHYDAIIAPTKSTTAPPIDQEFLSAIPTKDTMGAVGNVLGLPSISVPSGFNERGLTTGIQIMGRAYNDNTILAVARAYQSLTDWHKRHPIIE